MTRKRKKKGAAADAPAPEPVAPADPPAEAVGDDMEELIAFVLDAVNRMDIEVRSQLVARFEPLMGDEKGMRAMLTSLASVYMTRALTHFVMMVGPEGAIGILRQRIEGLEEEMAGGPAAGGAVH